MISEPFSFVLDGTGLVIPAGWMLIRLVGGDHDGTLIWSHRPPQTFRVVPDGVVYERRADTVWVADGVEWVAEPPSDDQMTLA